MIQPKSKERKATSNGLSNGLSRKLTGKLSGKRPEKPSRRPKPAHAHTHTLMASPLSSPLNSPMDSPMNSPMNSMLPSLPRELCGGSQRKIIRNIRSILTLLGENAEREGLKQTPKRYAKTMAFLTSGYQKSVDEVVGKALFSEESSEIIIVRDIELFSLCEHHLLPFYGKAHVAYIPDGKIIGLSKIPRIIDVFARRLQVQERLTTQISEELMRVLKPLGVAVIIEAFHLCMMMRGVEKQHSYTITSSMLGAFRNDATARKELLDLLGGLGNNVRR